MRYLFKEIATARAHGQVFHTVMYCETHLHLTRPPFKTDVSYDASKLNIFFFLSLSHSIKEMSVFLKSVCAIWEKTLFRCFSTLDQLVPLFSSLVSLRKPQGLGEFTFSHIQTRSNPFKGSIWKYNPLHANFENKKGLCLKICAEQNIPKAYRSVISSNN